MATLNQNMKRRLHTVLSIKHILIIFKIKTKTKNNRSRSKQYFIYTFFKQNQIGNSNYAKS